MHLPAYGRSDGASRSLLSLALAFVERKVACLFAVSEAAAPPWQASLIEDGSSIPCWPRPSALQAWAATAEAVPSAHVDQLLPAGSGGGSNWQKKGGGAAAPAGIAGAAADGGLPAVASGPWADALGSAALLAGGLDGTEAELAEAAVAAAAARGGPRQQLVVVASLLTKAPNLAGLARTCEVFR